MITRRDALAALGAALAGAATPVFAAHGGEESPVAEMVLGDDGAPVTIIEYASLTCPHCASFHKDTLPRIKANYIDTGKARLIYRDFPTAPAAVSFAAAMLARCAGKERFFGFIEVLFRTQENWMRERDSRKALGRIGRLGGVTQAAFDACLNDAEMFQGIKSTQEKASSEFEVYSTPTFIINGEKIVGAQPYERFEEVLERMLAKS